MRRKSSLFVASVTVALLLVDVMAGEGTRRPFQSTKAPKETVVNYEVVFPQITYKDSKQAYPRVLHINIPTQRGNYSLILELNEQLLSRGFTSRYYGENGQEVVTKGHANCFYQGWLKDRPDWRVTMSTCHGLQGSFGDLENDNTYFHLEPLNKLDSSVEQSHAFYLDSEYKHEQGSCGSNHSHVSKEGTGLSNVQEVRRHSHGRLRRQSMRPTRIVEWIIVSDHEQYIANGRNVSATIMRALEVANKVDALYRQLMIRVVLTEAITWTTDNQIPVSPDPNTLLNEFKGYRQRISSRHDSTMLLTGIDLDNVTVGIAFTRTMCSDTLSVGVTQDGGRSLSSTASTAAHELGHLLNMGHDDAERQCSCADGDQGCIMAALPRYPPPTNWSSCSKSDLDAGFSMFNLGRCLLNQPTRTVGDPVCGNGIREGDEVCDCGSPQECTDPCCNAATCQLASGAQCSAGACCASTCQFVSYGTQCKAATGDCDIAEYCSGDSGECPADEVKLDGTVCDSGVGYCYSGRCPTHNAQCQGAFGSNKAVDICYDQLNTLGDMSGNCGQNSTVFLPCSESNVQCGQLQCMSGEFQGRVGVSVVNTTVSITPEICRSFTTLPGSNVDTLSPGLVEDGTQCGTGLFCLSQRCVPVSQITSLACGTAANGLVCAGNGVSECPSVQTNLTGQCIIQVCNNHGECSCNIGFTGTDCETSRSEQAFDDDSGDTLLAIMAGIVGATLFLLVVLTVVIFIITLNIRRSDQNGKSSSFKVHYSVTYHTSSANQRLQSEVELSDDALSYETLDDEKTTTQIKVDMSKEAFFGETHDEEKTSEVGSASQTAEDESSKPTSGSVNELVPVRLAPQRPPARKPPPVPTRFVSSQSAMIDQDQDAPEPSQSDTLATNDTPTTLVQPNDQIGEQKPLTVELPNGTKQPTLYTSHGVPQQAQAEASKEDTSTATQKQLPLPDSNEPIKKVDVPKPQLRPAPMAPPKAEKPSAPARHDVPVKPQPALKPIPASKPTPAPKPGSVPVTTNGAASAPAPKPKPKPLVPAQKPAVKLDDIAPAAKPDREVPPKPGVKPVGLNNKPKPAPKPLAKAAKPTVTTAPKPPTTTAAAPKPLVTGSKHSAAPTVPKPLMTTAHTPPQTVTTHKPPVAPRSTTTPKSQFDTSAGGSQFAELQDSTTKKPIPPPRK